MDSKNISRVALIAAVIVLVSMILIPPVYSGSPLGPGSEPDPTPINPCPTGYECMTPSEAEKKFGTQPYFNPYDPIYEKYSDDPCGDLVTSTGKYCYKWLKPCPTGYECMTETDAIEKFGQGKHVIYSSTYVCGYEGYSNEFPDRRLCHKSIKIEPTDEKEEVDVCSLCPDPNDVGLGECVGYECSGPASLQHYKAEKVEITKCKYENGSVVVEYGYISSPDKNTPPTKISKLMIKTNDGETKSLGFGTLPVFEDKCTGDELTEHTCQLLTLAVSDDTRVVSRKNGKYTANTFDKVYDKSKGNKVYAQTFKCTYGCENGACICRDTDGPKNYYKKGSVVGAEYIYDFCDVQRVMEQDPVIVNDECEIIPRTHMCGDDEICKNGACVTGTLCDNGIQDIGEGGIDCGGDCPTTCCEDGIKNDDEEDIDCGGSSCTPCNVCAAANAGNLPSKFDWRKWKGKNWVSPIKSQGRCGSCSVFAAVGVVETKYNLEHSGGKYVMNINLSEQQILSDGAGSCTGGTIQSALDYIQEKGIVYESTVPYTSQNCLDKDKECVASCDHDTCSNPGSIPSYSSAWEIDNRLDEVVSDSERLKYLIVCKGPQAAMSKNWHHAFVVVGWDDDSDICWEIYGFGKNGCWIIKNSHGVFTDWGGKNDDVWHEDGFAYIPYWGHPYSDLIDYPVWDVSGVH